MGRYELPDYSQVKDDLQPMPDGNPADVYGAGFVGAYYDGEGYEQAREAMSEAGLPFAFGAAASQYGLTGAANPNGIYLLHKEVERAGINVNTIAYASQPVGNCVSRGTQNALLHTLCAAVNHGTGSIPPEMVAASASSNPISSECLYWWKWSGSRPGGDGWYAGACLKAAKEKGGMVVRADYRSIGGPDLRVETKATTHAYASESIPEGMRKIIHLHPLEAYAECKTIEEVADAIASGHAVQTDGGQGWASTVDEHGFAQRRGSWSHSMCATGIVRTEEAKKRYNTTALILIQNSWANFNRNDHATVMGTNGIKMPKGSFFARWEDCKNRSWFAVSSVKGWENRKLPNWNLGDLI